MFRAVGIFLSILLSVVLGWLISDINRVEISPNINQQDSFAEVSSSEENSSSITKNEDSNESNYTIEKNSTTAQSTENSIEQRLKSLLKRELFYDALSLYLNSPTSDNNRVIMESYLSELSKKDTIEAIKLMIIFRENEPQNRLYNTLFDAYVSQYRFKEAIALVMLERDNYTSEERDKRLLNQLRDVSQKYIEFLAKSRREYDIRLFLEEMIDYNLPDNYYNKELNEVDEKRAEESQKDNYDYRVALIKRGEHFIAKVWLDGIELNLMLDTGASYIFVDESKISNLELLRDDLVLHTASDDIVAKLYRASSLEIGELRVDNIEITTAPFGQDGVDGLLGMNFFKKFEFFINQDESILYLKWK